MKLGGQKTIYQQIACSIHACTAVTSVRVVAKDNIATVRLNITRLSPIGHVWLNRKSVLLYSQPCMIHLSDFPAHIQLTPQSESQFVAIHPGANTLDLDIFGFEPYTGRMDKALRIFDAYKPRCTFELVYGKDPTSRESLCLRRYVGLTRQGSAFLL